MYTFSNTRFTCGQTEYTELVWNVTPALQHRVFNSIRLYFSVATRSLAAFTDPHSCFNCAGLLFLKKPPKKLRHHGGCCLTRSWEVMDVACVFQSKKCGFHVTGGLSGWMDGLMLVVVMTGQGTLRVK